MTTHLADDAVVWLPYEPKELDGLPEQLSYRYWDGQDDMLPGNPAEVRFLTGYPGTQGYASLVRVLSRARNLEVLQVLSSGFDYLEAHLGLLPAGTRLATGRGVHAAVTAEHAVALLAATARGLPDFHRQQAAGRWAPRSFTTLGGKRILVVGQGPVGTAVASLLDAFGCHVVRLARTARIVAGAVVHGAGSLSQLLPTVDGAVLCAPATPQTYGMFDEAALSLLPDGALLVNVGRGELVDTDALTRAVASGQLRAALDVTDPEPLPEGHPLWGLSGALITPHIGAFTDAFEESSRSFLVQQLHRYARGEALANTVVRPDGTR
ncbi:NAD(P)-dependent oxidoreductase [Streptomyces enissocaesilis]|uniref:2-hydroxyacid dehydrogenase n=1 Tax=Streptomyces enissocaesilis TaxID=332589 RepID=A0ABP6K546_9ACTN